MLLLLVSVASWTTELARLDAIEALDAEIDAAEKAVDGAALLPRPVDAVAVNVVADVQLERHDSTCCRTLCDVCAGTWYFVHPNSRHGNQR